MSKSRADDSIVRIAPNYYIHVLDYNTNVTRLEIGPQTYIRQDNERLVHGPEKMITVPDRHYCVIENPVAREPAKEKGGPPGPVLLERSGQAKLHYADLELRFAQDPFPLYPGEVLKQVVQPMKTVAANSALRLKALWNFKDGDTEHVAGDEWLFEGPGSYVPRKEVAVEEVIRGTIIRPNFAVKLRARKETTDRQGKKRVTGEEWLVEKTGAYLPGAYEEVMELLPAYVLTEKSALHMRALRTFTDCMKVHRKAGEEWLIKFADKETHIPDVYEEVVGVVDIITLSSRHYCVILDPVDDKGKPQFGKRKLVKGEKSFFLLPGEQLEKGIQDVYVLQEDEGLIMKAVEAFTDVENKVERKPGDRWMIRGPIEYVPGVEVEVVKKRKAIPLDENEGIYVRNVKHGKIRSVTGETYMLNQDEELWEKELPATVEALLSSNHDALADRSDRRQTSVPAGVRDKTKVVTFRVPHNAAVQIYDYKQKKARVIFGPELVMLDPDEQFTQLSLSGGKPKKPNVIRSLCLLLGPDFCTDIIVVETSDHARLSLQLSYNWHFELSTNISKIDEKESAKLFSVPDFIGDACKAIASRVRGAVASVPFDAFHKNSAKIIRQSVFGADETTGKVRDKFLFPQNQLVITSIDIQSVEPVDQRTRDALQKSVQMAIEITTNSQEATARHEAERLEQEAKGRLERQKISDEAEAEKERKNFLLLQSESAAVESTGQAKAEAQSRAEASRIEGEAAVEQAKLKAEAMRIEGQSELERLVAARESENHYIAEQNTLEIAKTRELAEIESKKFQESITVLGTDTIKAMALAGPEMQVRMLQSLGLQTTLITDGNAPINLFNTAHGLISNSSYTPASKRNKTDEDSEA